MSRNAKVVRYFVQTTHAIISPDGEGEDYYFDKKLALEECKKLNVKLRAEQREQNKLTETQAGKP
jgi:hypothetical protein